METEQESTRVSSTTKSFRRRQRRKEAAALKKLSAKDHLEKDSLPEQSQNKRSRVIEGVGQEIEDLKFTENAIDEASGLSSLPSSLTLPSKIKVNSHFTHGLVVEPRENPISSSKRQNRSKRKVLISPEVNSSQQQNTDGVGQQRPELFKKDIQHTLHCNCSHERCSSETRYLSLLKESRHKENKTPFPVIGNYFEQPVVEENLINDSQNKCLTLTESATREPGSISKEKTVDNLEFVGREKSRDKKEERIEIETDKGEVYDEIKERRNKEGSKLFNLRGGEIKPEGNNKERIETEVDNPSGELYGQIKKCTIQKDSESFNFRVGENKSGSQPEILKPEAAAIDEEKIHPSSAFQERKDNSTASKVKMDVKFDFGLGSVVLEKNKNKESSKLDPQSMSGSPVMNKKTTAEEVEVRSGKKDGMESSMLNEMEKSKEQIKAEREARKMAKMAKKQKVNVTNEKDVNVSSSSSSNSSSATVNVANSESKNEPSDNKRKTEVITSSSNVNALEVGSKSKAELRAERRAKQEAQRAAKAAAAAGSIGFSESQSILKTTEKPSEVLNNQKAAVKENKMVIEEKGWSKAKPIRRDQGTKLLNRIGWDDSKVQRWKQNTLQDTHSIHPAVVQLGTRFADRIISGSNARCIAFVQAIKKVIEDYQTPPQKELGRDLESRLLTPSLTYLEAQRPHAVSVSNASRFLKWQLTQLRSPQLNVTDGSNASTESKHILPDDKAKHHLIEGLDSYIWEKIEVAEQAVCDSLKDKIKDGDVILTYGCSYLLQQIFIVAKEAGTTFKVIVVDGRPWKEGREMLRCLVALGIHCSYVLLSAASSVIRQVNKVLVGAHALLSNGYVMSRVGVSQVALLASAHNVPVLVACETHKFCERVQSDSFVYNEMGEPDGLTQLIGDEISPLSDWRSLPCLSLLNLSYDVTPPELVTAVATELAVLPCTSVPVILRVRPTEPVAYRH